MVDQTLTLKREGIRRPDSSVRTWRVVVFSIYDPLQQTLHKVHVDLVQVHCSNRFQDRLFCIYRKSEKNNNKTTALHLDGKERTANRSEPGGCSQSVTFVSDGELLQVELLIWDRVFHKVFLAK